MVLIRERICPENIVRNTLTITRPYKEKLLKEWKFDKFWLYFAGKETWKNCEGKKISWANNAVLKRRREMYLRKNAAAERGRKDPRWEKRYSRTAMDGWMVRRPRISGRTLFPGKKRRCSEYAIVGRREEKTRNQEYAIRQPTKRLFTKLQIQKSKSMKTLGNFPIFFY